MIQVLFSSMWSYIKRNGLIEKEKEAEEGDYGIIPMTSDLFLLCVL